MSAFRLALLLSVAGLAACDKGITGSDRCGDEGIGELHVVVRPAPGFGGFGVTVFVGDTIPLVGEVRPVTGSSVDVWGSGGCRTDYGDPVPATIVWSSANAGIATVKANGVVRGVAEGTVAISARSQEHGLAGNLAVAVWVRAGS